MQFGITNPNDNEGLMDLISCGAQLVFLVTGRGNVVGSAISPVVKITGNSRTYARMQEDMDFDAGRVLHGECSMDELTDALDELVLRTVSGEMSKAEKLGHKEYFVPYNIRMRLVDWRDNMFETNEMFSLKGRTAIITGALRAWD